MGQREVFRLKAGMEGIRLEVIGDQTGMMPGLLKRRRKVHHTIVGGGGHIPAGVITLLKPVHVEAHTGAHTSLMNQAHLFGIVESAEKACPFHNITPSNERKISVGDVKCSPSSMIPEEMFV